jgi:ABC-type transporter Mla MlaB component
MATNEDRPSLLSKVAMFVRNPTKDWSELDQVDQPDDSGYDKQALKAMIERKRQNDFVRKREFDQLRKLRNRDPGAIAAAARPSFFQTSIPTDPDGRAVTLKKIDEIEAQMSKQWWKGKQDAAALGAGATPQVGESAPSSTEAATLAPAVASEHFARTTASEIGVQSRSSEPTDFAPTEMGSGMAPMGGKGNTGRSPLNPAPVAAGSAATLGFDQGFSASKLFAIDSDEMATDPELEEAAIRFANGDDAGAESGLLEALRAEHVAPDVAISWAAALFDLYRATDNRAGFDRAMEDISGRFQNLQPVWSSIADAASEATSAQASGQNDATPQVADKAMWSSPAVLTLASMELLRETLGAQPMPWHLDWTLLDHVEPDAMPLLCGLFSSLCNEPVSLRFTGAEQLVQTLRSMTPSGDRGVEMSAWQVRMDVLRSMRMQDEFELAALDYCVTYEVSPPGWLDARCQFEDVTATVNSQIGDKGIVVTAPMGLDDGSAATVDLRGEILGDATQALAALDRSGSQSENVVISCAALVRVDFSAAGSILNWVATRQASGSHVQFRDVHRLVAAFFTVIGINEHARVVPRSM